MSPSLIRSKIRPELGEHPTGHWMTNLEILAVWESHGVLISRTPISQITMEQAILSMRPPTVAGFEYVVDHNVPRGVLMFIYSTGEVVKFTGIGVSSSTEEGKESGALNGNS